jgi:hypothetical protein
MTISIDYTDFSVHVDSPQVDVVIQDLLNDIRTAEATEQGITHMIICDGTGKASLGGGVEVGITLKLIDPWQLEFYAGDYRATISGGNLVTDRADGNVIKWIVNGPQIEILRAASATIATVSTGSGLSTEEHNKLYATATQTQAAAIQAKTDDLRFTIPNMVDVNIKSVNDSGSLSGTGVETDPWGP